MSDNLWTYSTMPAGIPVQCFTNLDGYERERWPTHMACRPTQGDCVEARSGKTLKVVRVTHAERAVLGPGGVDTGERAPYLKVELHR